jgi:hypothetical protein
MLGPEDQELLGPSITALQEAAFPDGTTPTILTNRDIIN